MTKCAPCGCIIDDGDKFLVVCQVHQAKDAEIERLRKIITDAPCDDTCDWRLYGYLGNWQLMARRYGKPCNCVKSEVEE